MPIILLLCALIVCIVEAFPAILVIAIILSIAGGC